MFSCFSFSSPWLCFFLFFGWLFFIFIFFFFLLLIYCWFVLATCLGFVFSSSFPFFFFHSFFSGCAVWLVGSWLLAMGQHLSRTLSPGCWITETSWVLGILTSMPSRISISTPRPGSSQLPAGSNPGHFMPNNQQGQTAHPSASRLPEVIVSPQTPQNTKSTAALTIRQKRLRAHQNMAHSLSPGRLHKPWTKLTLQWTENRSKKN